ncbi:MAG: SEC-C metal-binding domain-containing protein [Syntrophobacteraceae bacterium]
MKIGQNDLCLCGSGIKYKKCCANKQEGGGQRAGLGAVMDEVRELLRGQSFASLEEANTFLSLRMQQRNRLPKDDFDGLSAEQMHRFLYFPFETPHLVSFPSCLDVAPEAQILTLFSLLAEVLGDQGMKATATGNLPRKFCRDAALAFLGEEKYRENFRFGDLRSEPEFFDLHVTRLVSGLSGFVRKYKGKFIISRECRKLMTQHGLASIYPRLFQAFVTSYNWAFRDGWQEIPLIQHSFLFTLHLLKKHGTEWQTSRFYQDCFLRAFPTVLKEVAPIGEYYSAEEILRSCYSHRCLESFAGFLGLAEIQHDSAKRYTDDFCLRKLPLLDHVVQFHL